MTQPITQSRGFRIAVAIVVVLMVLGVCLSEIIPATLGQFPPTATPPLPTQTATPVSASWLFESSAHIVQN